MNLFYSKTVKDELKQLLRIRIFSGYLNPCSLNRSSTFNSELVTDTIPLHLSGLLLK